MLFSYLFDLATKDDIKALSYANVDTYAKTSLRIEQLEDRINRLDSDVKLLDCESVKQALKDQYEPAVQLIESKAQAAIQNLRAQYDLNMTVQDKNARHIKRLEDRIFDLENPKPKKKKSAAKAKK
jgi:hypothetical protein